MSAQPFVGEVVDRDAIEIGDLYSKARGSLVESVKFQIECGARLAQKKSELGHGNWLPWLAANEATLGFSSARTAQMLIKAASNTKSTSYFGPEEAVQVSRQVWGNDNHRALGTGQNEWYTPPEYVEAARAVLGSIELDPASSAKAQETIRAARYLTASDNALTKPWVAETVYLNPPYSQPEIYQFIDKLVNELAAGNVGSAILLTHNYTDTLWFHRAEEVARAICFTRGRVKFVDENGAECAPTQGQAFFYFGDEPEKFSECFIEYGFIR